MGTAAAEPTRAMAAVAAKNFMLMDELVGWFLKELKVVVVLWC